MTEAAKDLRRKIRPLFLEKDGVTPKATKVVYDVVGTILTMAVLTYTAVSFVLLVPSLAWRVYSSMYHVGYIVVIVGFVLLRFVLPSPRRVADQKTQQKVN